MFPEQAYAQGRISIGPGDLLVLYTDGVIEARHDGALFGESRLRRLVGSLTDVDVRDMSTRLFEAVREFGRGSLSDDLALLALCVGPRPSATERTSGSEPATAGALVSSFGARFPGEGAG
jgi:serine phosphatase RsbU (regulator of sigma subunit)